VDSLTYLLVDFENLQPPAQDIALVRGAQFRLWVFHGPKQKKFSAEMVVAWQPLGSQVKFVQSSKEGKNALDFHIAFCLGQAQKEDAAEGRKARYVVVSGDGGFDPLFEYMRGLGCDVTKVLTIPAAIGSGSVVSTVGPTAKLPAPPPPPAKPSHSL
jgi:hypothetical protein